MKLTIEIELGNDGMHTPKQVERALKILADDIGWNGFGVTPDEGIIRDVNGNIVGKWGVIQ